MVLYINILFRISWTNHVINEEVLNKVGKERSLMKFIRKIQLQFLGYIMTKEGLENLTITGKIEGKRSRGRQRLTYLLGKSKQMDGSTTTKEHKVKNVCTRVAENSESRTLWRAMVTCVLIGHGR